MAQFKYSLILVALILSCKIGIGQSSLISKYNKPNYRINEYQLEAMRYTINHHYLKYGLRGIHFYNERFYEQIRNENIKYLYGNEATFSWCLYPVSVDFTWFSVFYDMANSGIDFFTDNHYRVKHRGIEFFINYKPLPYFGKFSEYVSPYIGMGYQTSHLVAIGIPVGSNSEISETVSSVDTGSFIWKVGIAIKVYEGVTINGEYKQTLNIDVPSAFNAWNISLGLPLFINYYD